jgi:transmembrane sensor
MTREQIDDILQRYLRDQCTEEEIRFVDNWIENIQFSTDELTIHENKKEIIRNKVWASVSNVEDRVLAVPAANTDFNYWKLGRRIAASFAVIAVSTFLFLKYSSSLMPTKALAFEGVSSSEIVIFSNVTNKPALIELKDGSTILVHPGSEIKYPKTFGTKREVSLSGEAFFHVAKDPKHPFLVYSNEVTTRVLGTSFLIKAYNDQKKIIVSVSTGRVSVFSKPADYDAKHIQDEVILTPNQQAVYRREKGTVEKQLVENPRILVDNKSMEVSYTNEPVTKLFKTLEKMYGVSIRYNENALANCNITTEMTDEGLFERMDIICLVLGAKYKVEDTVIKVEANGCSN